MESPAEISFRNMDRSDAVEARIREKVAKLEQFFDRMTSCRVIVEARHRQHHKGNLYHVRIDVGVPGNTVIIDRDPAKNHAHEDVYIAIRDAFAVAIRDAFKAAQRRLEDHSKRRSGRVKTHEVPPHGRVIRLFAYEGYGFIETAEGQEIYFHKNSLVDADFDKLETGQEVRLVMAEAESEKGPQASTVKLVGKHHLTG